MLMAATLRTALVEAWTNRRSFWAQVSFMIVNDLSWIAFWALFFNKVGDVRGWNVQHILLLFAVLTTVCGISLGLLANARKVGALTADGELDAALALPIHPLAYLLVRRVDIGLLGDLLFGPALFLAAGGLSVERVAVYVVASLCGAAVMVGFMVALGALTLFVGGRGEQADLGFQAILILSSYPVDLFAGATKLLLFTAVPAAFVTGLPTALVDEFSFETAAALAAAAAFFLGIGLIAFQLGMRRYASGAVWTKA